MGYQADIWDSISKLDVKLRLVSIEEWGLCWTRTNIGKRFPTSSVSFGYKSCSRYILVDWHSIFEVGLE